MSDAFEEQVANERGLALHAERAALDAYQRGYARALSDAQAAITGATDAALQAVRDERARLRAAPRGGVVAGDPALVRAAQAVALAVVRRLAEEDS